MNYDCNINRIVLAIFVAAGTGDAIHKNRPTHGLAIHKGGEKIYTFSNDIRKNSIPKCQFDTLEFANP